VVIPHHGVIDDTKFGIERLAKLDIPWNGTTIQVLISVAYVDDVSFYFIRGWPYFDLQDKFVYSADAGIDIGRYLFFAYATLQLAAYWRINEDWVADVVHANDWHTAGFPYLMRQNLSSHAAVSNAAIVFSIHNMQYQGWGVEWHLTQAGLPPAQHPLLVEFGKTDCMLGLALAYSTILSTVSPHYAEEIIQAEGGYGLEELLHARQTHLVGILNGIDARRWNPVTSTAIAKQFSSRSLKQRLTNKIALQHELGLREDVEVPLIGVVTRLVDQKGPSIMMSAIHSVLANRDAQFVLLGTGQAEHEARATQLMDDYPSKARIKLLFDENLSERIYAGSDIFFMPSLFEPCGIGQMLAMRYGSVPVVRAVGGLVDTVSPEIGFLFTSHDAAAAADALNSAVDSYLGDKPGWKRRQALAMRQDFSWVKSANSYTGLYTKAVELKLQYA
jgi:starch synthase